MGEEWKVIPGFDLYEVSNYGRIKCHDREKRNNHGIILIKEHYLKPQDNGCGYGKVQLKQDGKRQRFYIHRLVASAFIPNPENKPFINHLDNNPMNNHVSNLAWCTQKENVDWMIKQGRNKRTQEWLDNLHKAQERDYKPVIATNVISGEVLYFASVNSTKEHNFTCSSVVKCCKGERKIHKGYTWRYANTKEKDNGSIITE